MGAIFIFTEFHLKATLINSKKVKAAQKVLSEKEKALLRNERQQLCVKSESKPKKVKRAKTKEKENQSLADADDVFAFEFDKGESESASNSTDQERKRKATFADNLLEKLKQDALAELRAKRDENK